MTILEKISRLSNSEKIIGFISLIIGLLLTYDSIYLIYAYHFTGILFMFITPMNTLVVNLIIGLLLIISSLYLLKNIVKSRLCYQLSGIIIIIYPFNENLIDIIRNDWYVNSLFIFISIPFGLLLLFYNRNKVKEQVNKKIQIHRLIIIKFLICFALYTIVDVLFMNWTYLDRIM